MAFVFLLPSFKGHSQELLCEINLNAAGVQSVDPRVLTDMKRAIKDFMNQRRWTNDNFKTEERIKCTIALSLSGTVGNYTATAQIIASRPVYGTSYETKLLNFLDKEWGFQYVEGQPLDFQPGTFSNNLTSLLAYYAYIIIGLDYDSFSKLGGKNYYQLAQQVGQNATQGGLKGWNQFDGTNTRYFLLENLMSQQFASFRESLYEYHRKGLDTYSDKPEDTRPILLEVLRRLKVAFEQRPTSIFVKTFIDMKAPEFVKVLKEATKPEQKQEAYNLLLFLDPQNTDTYSELIK
ncbi:MAG TPA: DUF4835 family protein [Catalimonadaceae bacterium]|nr:DUF4835 family protein [Catalimonadaceae bacterium]HPI12213.1 DUF4835 family protein [Catalimonadaceae bacterium]